MQLHGLKYVVIELKIEIRLGFELRNYYGNRQRMTSVAVVSGGWRSYAVIAEAVIKLRSLSCKVTGHPTYKSADAEDTHPGKSVTKTVCKV